MIDPKKQIITGLESWVSRYLVMTRAEREWWRRYNRYLNSEGWVLTREACLRRDGYNCRQCGFTGGPGNPLKANHLTFDNYNRTGRTPVSDLQTLCRRCLQMIASRTRRVRHITLELWLRLWWWELTLKQKMKVIALAVVVLWFLHGALITQPTAVVAAPGYSYGGGPPASSVPRMRVPPPPG